MGLSCVCDGDYDEFFQIAHEDYETLNTSRRKRCESCKTLIDLGATVIRFHHYRNPRSDLEEEIHGIEVNLADKYFCEECADIYYSLDELGFCVEFGESMQTLLAEYQEYYK